MKPRKAAELPPGMPEMNQDTQEFDSEKQPEPQGPVNPLQEELDTLRSEMALLKTEALRERADLENQRKRVARDVEQARKFANEKLLGDLLPVLDNLERAVTAGGEDVGALKAGVELTQRELLRVVTANGLAAVGTAGEPFDPERHQAMSMVDGNGHASGCVAAVMQRGYVLNDRLLRPALVMVAK